MASKAKDNNKVQSDKLMASINFVSLLSLVIDGKYIVAAVHSTIGYSSLLFYLQKSGRMQNQSKSASFHLLFFSVTSPRGDVI